MKTLQLIFFSILFMFATSCNRSSEINTQEPDVLTGVYSLREFSPGFGPLESYNPNDIIWQFMPKNSLKVTINTTNIPSNSQLPYTSTVSVTYQLNESNKVIINNVVYQISITDNKLILDADSSSDGKRITFDKIEI